MAVGRITKRSVEALPLPVSPARSYLWDDTLKGFGVMVTAAGSRSYLVQYQMGGRGTPTRRATIGKHGAPWTAEKARDRATGLLEMIRRGVDPVEDERQRRAAAVEEKEGANRLAFDAFVDHFVKRYVEVGGRKGKGQALRSAEDIKAVFRRDLTPVFKQRPISKITRHEIATCLDGIGDRSLSAAIKAHKWLRTMFTWAVDRGAIGASPMQGMPPPGEDGERDRVLKGDELRAVWAGAEAMHEPYAAFFKTLMLTGQRLREVAGMRWGEVDLDEAVWIIPGTRLVEGERAAGGAKNKRDHLVPLASAVVDLLRALRPAKVKAATPVFTTDGEKPINGFSKPKAKLDGEVAKALGKLELDELPLMQPWVLHDLRRSFSTGCQPLGFSRDLIHEAINQKSSGAARSKLQRTYQLHDYRAEKATLMEAWARHVEGLVAGERKVLPFVRAEGGR